MEECLISNRQRIPFESRSDACQSLYTDYGDIWSVSIELADSKKENVQWYIRNRRYESSRSDLGEYGATAFEAGFRGRLGIGSTSSLPPALGFRRCLRRPPRGPMDALNCRGLPTPTLVIIVFDH